MPTGVYVRTDKILAGIRNGALKRVITPEQKEQARRAAKNLHYHPNYLKWIENCKNNPTIPTCHPDREHVAKGYCAVCYELMWRKNHPKESRRKTKDFEARHPYRKAIFIANKKAKKYGVLSTLTEIEWIAKVESSNFQCYWCPQKLTLERGKHNTLSLDHLTPLSRGGSNTIENVVPSCIVCNLAKHMMTADEFVTWIFETAVKLAGANYAVAERN